MTDDKKAHAMSEARRIADIENKNARCHALSNIPKEERYLTRYYYDMIVRKRLESNRKDENHPWRK